MTSNILEEASTLALEEANSLALHEDHSGKNDQFRFIDTLSRFSGLAVAQLYILCAAVTVYEVIARYVFNKPTTWAFEIVMVLCATAWTLSAGYVTLKNRHIGITVFYLMGGAKVRWWLDIFAYTIGVIALFLFIDDTLKRSLLSIDIIERTGSAFNSPQPMLLKTVLVLGALLYLIQLLVNLWRHFENQVMKTVVSTITVLILLRLTSTLFIHYDIATDLFTPISASFGTVGEYFNPQNYINAKDYPLGIVSLCMVSLLFLLMMTGMPLGIVTLFVSIMTALFFFGSSGLYLVSTNAVGLLEKYPLVAVPLFVLMSSILEKAGVAEDLFDAMSLFAGRLRGGVAVQTVAVAVVLAAMSGVMGGEIVMLGLVALPQMLRLGYDSKIAIGVICASGVLATLIPPSIIMIIYGLSASVAIGDLFLAGAVPGLMLAFFYAAYVVFRCYLNHDLAPTAAEVADRRGEKTSMTGEKRLAVALCILLIASVMGSIYAGIASVTEAAAVGVIGSIIVALIRNKLNWTLLQEALTGTMSTVGTIIWLILGAVAFVGIYNLIGGAGFMRSLFADLGLSALGIIFVMMGILVVLGTFMEWIAIVFITVPVFAPVIRDLAPELGMTPDWAAVWFGVLFVMNMQIYFLSPPFGPACFWLKSVAPPEISLQRIYAAVLPFIALQLIGVALVLSFPKIALFLPMLLGGS